MKFHSAPSTSLAYGSVLLAAALWGGSIVAQKIAPGLAGNRTVTDLNEERVWSGASWQESTFNYGEAMVDGLYDGSVTVKTDPLPRVLVVRTVPPWASAISFTIASPRPAPPDSLSRAGSPR